jgi:O-antigen ligase
MVIKSLSLHQIYNGKILLYLFAIALYLPMIFTNVLTILIVVNTILNYKKIKLRKILNKKSVIVFFTMYFLIFVGFFHDISFDGVLNDLEKKLSFIIIPFSIVVMNVNKKDVERILALFFFSGILFTSLAFFNGLSQFLSTSSLEFITNHGLSMNIGMHATYLSMYLLFSLAYPVLFYENIKTQRDKGVIILLSILKTKELKFNRVFFLLSGFLIVIFSLIMFVPPLKKRLKEVVNYDNNYNISKTWQPNAKEVWGGRGIRLLIWESCIDLIRENPLIGYGSTSEVQERLNENYESKEIGPLLFLMNNRGKVFNAHNQYFEEVLKFGVILGLMLPFILIGISISSYKGQSILGLYFVFIIFGVSFTETILELNKGIVFFSFFFALILNNSKQIHHKEILPLPK